jgi:hypothetical protein
MKQFLRKSRGMLHIESVLRELCTLSYLLFFNENAIIVTFYLAVNFQGVYVAKYLMINATTRQRHEKNFF